MRSQISWKANGQLFQGDAQATATMNGTSIVLAGVSLTTAQIGFTIAEPAGGFVNGTVIPMNMATAPGTAGAYEAVGAAETYSTANGGNVTMELNYVVPVNMLQVRCAVICKVLLVLELYLSGGILYSIN